MAKIRTIKPAMTTDEKLAEVSRDAELLFILTLMFVDDAGRMEYSPKRLKMQAFPSDRDRELDIAPLVSELCEYRLVVVYEFEGRKHLCIPNFLKHQKISKPTASILPPPPSVCSTWNIRENPSGIGKIIPEQETQLQTGKKVEELEVELEKEVELEGKEPGVDSIELEFLDQQVNQIGHEYPGNDHLRGNFLPRDQQEAIAQAVMQDGYRRVSEGTIAIRDAVVNWPAHEKKFIPNAAKFWREKQYLKDASFWERGNGQVSKNQQRVANNRNAILAGLGVGKDAGPIGPDRRAGVDAGGNSVVVGDVPQRESGNPRNSLPKVSGDG